MFDDRQAQPSAARVAASRGIDSVKAFGQARNMARFYSVTMVPNDKDCPVPVPPHRYIDLTALRGAAIAQGIANEIVGKLQQLTEISTHRRKVQLKIRTNLASPLFQQWGGMVDGQPRYLARSTRSEGGLKRSASILDRLIKSSTIRNMRLASLRIVSPNRLRSESSIAASSASVSA
jgi:hypothetical protein